MPDYVIKNVYQIGDFATSGGNIAPPNERGATAQGNPPFQMQLNPGTEPFSIVITDSDPNFQETPGADPLQELAQDATIDGVLYPAGSHVVLNYELTAAGVPTGYSITIGAPNSGGNTTTAFVALEPLPVGTSFTYTNENNIGGGAGRPYATFVCFTAGSLISTPNGPRLIERLKPGDLVDTSEHGAQKLRWIGTKTTLGIGQLAPVVIRKGTLGALCDVRVSPQHRMAVAGPALQLLFGEDRMLVAASHLVNGRTILQLPQAMVTYVHIAFDRHEIVTLDGTLSETLLVNHGALNAVTEAQAEELLHLFPGSTVSKRSAHRETCLAAAKRHEALLIEADDLVPAFGCQF
ncbi:MAG: Hint domain-containing protein [Pseudomonadota bacterium]